MEPAEKLIDLIEELISALDAFEAAKDDPRGCSAKILRELQGRVIRVRDALRKLLRNHPVINLKGLSGNALRRLKIKLRRLFGPGIDDAFLPAGRAASRAASRAAPRFGRLLGRALRLLGGGVVVGVLDVLLNPTPISGMEKKELDTYIINLSGKCYKCRCFKTRPMDELAWSNVQVEIEEIECPEEERGE